MVAGPLFRRDHIGIYRLGPGATRVPIIDGSGGGQSFLLPKPDIYSLEGPNQSGKTVLIKFLMGVPPPGVVEEKITWPTVVKGKTVQIGHVADAIRHGLVAVFADDALIPSMTISEQLVMRHSTATWRHIAAVSAEWLSPHKFVYFLRSQFPEAKWLHRLSPAEKYLYPQHEVLENARVLLAEYGDQYTKVLDQYPRELSRGATAVARLVQAQLTRGISVLFLDEALSGVQATVWPHLVDRLRAWQERSGAAIVVVTHSKEELLRWSPSQRYQIEDSHLRTTKVRDYAFLIPGIPARPDAFPVFVWTGDKATPPWLPDLDGPVIALIDETVRALSPTKEVIRRFEQWSNCEVRVVLVKAGEEHKTVQQYLEVATQMIEDVGSKTSAIVLIGGGVVLNLAGLVAATLYRGRFPVVLVPTTVMAVADVAVGSKTSVNVQSSGGRWWKHPLGVYANPTAVVAVPAYFDSLSARERVLGLSECLKHGLLQDPALFETVLQLLSTTTPNAKACFDVALTVMRIKGRVLAHDPWEERFGRLLLYGHRHAHSLERALDLALSHGSAVHWGILVELALGATPSLFEPVLALLRDRQAWLWTDWKRVDRAELKRAYDEDPLHSGAEHAVISLTQVGQYRDPLGSPLRMAAISEIELWHVIDEILQAVP